MNRYFTKNNLISTYANLQDIITNSEKVVIGRKKELEVLLSVLSSGEHILLEGPPGTTKSTILRYVTSQLNLPLYQVEGSADLTPSKLIGTFNPNLVLENGFKPEYFEPGPLFNAMDEGGILYIDELNRAAPDATNTLIRAMEEREIVIPRFGKINAKDNFRVITAMNPYDDTGVTRISRALFDRLCRIKMDYQNLDQEIQIVISENANAHPSLVEIGTKIARATRNDDRLRQGASIRGAIDFVNIASSLASIRGNYSIDVIIDAAYAAFTGKIWLENPNHSEEQIILDIVESVIKNLKEDVFKSLNLSLKKKTTET